jgi:hypothetical protein
VRSEDSPHTEKVAGYIELSHLKGTESVIIFQVLVEMGQSSTVRVIE